MVQHEKVPMGLTAWTVGSGRRDITQSQIVNFVYLLASSEM